MVCIVRFAIVKCYYHLNHWHLTDGRTTAQQVYSSLGTVQVLTENIDKQTKAREREKEKKRITNRQALSLWNKRGGGNWSSTMPKRTQSIPSVVDGNASSVTVKMFTNSKKNIFCLHQIVSFGVWYQHEKSKEIRSMPTSLIRVSSSLFEFFGCFPCC